MIENNDGTWQEHENNGLVFIDYTLPAYWASALVNDDWSGLEDAEDSELKVWLEAEGGDNKYFHCTGVDDDVQFSWRNDANNLGGDVCTFTFQIA